MNPAAQMPRATPVVLCFLMRETAQDGHKVLLGMKKTGFGVGRIVTLGGHVEPGESPEAAAVREVFEESGVTITEADLEPAGTIEFIFPARPEWDMSTTVYRSWNWLGEPMPSSEIDPAWYPADAVPYPQMWEDSAHWLPRVLDGDYFAAAITLAPDNECVASVVFSST